MYLITIFYEKLFQIKLDTYIHLIIYTNKDNENYYY